MRTYARRRAALAVAAVVSVLLIAACSSPDDDGGAVVRPPPARPTLTRAPAGTPAPAETPAPAATSAASFGGMAELVAAAKREGRLDVAAPVPERANYGEIVKAFTAAYGIEVSLPAGSSQDELDVVNRLKGGQPQGDGPVPDVLDVGMPVALANTSLFAPYRVQTWNDIPERHKDPTGLWFQDHGGLLAIGYDSAKVPDVTSVFDLLDPAFRNKVALSGDPTRSDAALYAVQMVSLATGGSLDEISYGTYFFTHLVAVGNFVPLHATPETVRSGRTPVVLDWDYRSAARVADVPTWKVFVPEDAVLVAYRAQAVNKHAPHPAAARLWVEFLASDAGQRLRLEGGAQPIRPTTTAGSRGQATAGALPRVSGTPAFLSQEQLTKAKAQLDYGWPRAMAIGIKARAG